MKLSPQPYNEKKYLEAAQKLQNLALSNPDLFRNLYAEKPITALRILDTSIRFPKKLASLFALIWKQASPRFIVKGPRGGGKSKLLGALGFALWFFKHRNIVDMGGSLEQAKNVYNYFSGHCYSNDAILDSIPQEPLLQRTVSDKGNYFKAISASPKAIRGPHPDVLFIDEAVEANWARVE